jgi:hypothetical protein
LGSNLDIWYLLILFSSKDGMKKVKKQPVWQQPLFSVKNQSHGLIYMTSLIQWQTYEHLLEGYPAPDINDMILKNLSNRAAKFYGLDEAREQGSYYIKAKTTFIAVDADGSLGDEEHLPVVTCAAKFCCEEPIGERDYSQLVFLWHQAEPALPIDKWIMKVIEEIEWQKYAEDLNY